jgi:signal transduction histidine kinase
MKYGYHWLFIIVGFLIMLFRDLSRVYSMAISGGLQLLTPYVLNFIFYSTMITALIATYNPEFKIKSMRDIDMEREFYKQRYEEIEYLSKDLLTVTELWFHDLQNDLSVINNAMELYDETSKTSFLGLIKKRVGLMEERQKKFETPAHILDSLKIQPTNLNILDGIQRAFSGVDLILPVESVYVKANKLLFPIVLNVVQNAFQQNSDSVQVSITVEEMNSTVILKIIDDGIGVPDGMKDKIFLKNFQGNKGGTSGMGLYLAKLTLAKFGGRISVEDNEPSGAVFNIELERIISNNK